MARNKYDIDERLETPFDFKHLKRALVYVKRHRKNMIIALLFSALSVVVSLLSPIIAQQAVDVAIPEGDVPMLLALAALMLATIAVSVIFSVIRSRIMTVVGQEIVRQMRDDLFAHLQKLPFSYYDDRPHGKILVRVINYINSVSDLLSNGIINFILEIFNLVFILIFMFFLEWRLAFIVVAGLPVFMSVMLLIKTRQRKAWQEVSNKSSNLNAYLHESIVGVKITQIFTREEENMGNFDRLGKSYRSAWMKAVACNNLIWPTIDTVQTAVSASIYLIGLLVIGPASVSLGTIFAMGNYSSRFWQPLLNLSNLFNNFINTIAYLERIFETMDEPVTVDDIEGATELPRIRGDVSFENVTFAYDEGRNVLENLSFTVKAGESIALVGPTGAGKTTIVSLLSRFYNVSGGRVCIDGNDISRCTLKSLRSQMGIMLQDSFIFSGTIADNIRYGRLDATDAEIRRAARAVCADDFISEFPDGYETEVNERGSKLSQGQKQLVSLARTMLSDPKILVLDEATSSIDAKTERLLQKGIQELLRGRTSFIIAHRLSTIKSCDRIMYISDKGITEAGTHDELMAKRGEYYKLYTAQM